MAGSGLDRTEFVQSLYKPAWFFLKEIVQPSELGLTLAPVAPAGVVLCFVYTVGCSAHSESSADSLPEAIPTLDSVRITKNILRHCRSCLLKDKFARLKNMD